MSLFLYDIFLAIYFFIVRIVSPIHLRAKKWIEGRRHVWEELEKLKGTKQRIWIHCSSLGEYEQALPLIEKLASSLAERSEAKQSPDNENEIVITFFSPSGYEVVKKKNPGRTILYLPRDSKSNASKFIELVNPRLAVFVRYDLWYHYLKELRQRSIKTILISAVFRREDVFFQWYGGLFGEMLKCFSHIFAQDDGSVEILSKHGFANATNAGDTRIDRVAAIRETAKTFPLIEKFKVGKKMFIIGSLEPKDEKIVLPMVNDSEVRNHFKFIIAPHNVSKKYVNQLKGKISGKTVLLSKATSGSMNDGNALIIDGIGMLSSLYRYADIVYIGGGFGEGLHNILEPAAWGKPIFFGPNHKKFIEAGAMINRGGAYVVNDLGELKQRTLLFLNGQLLESAGHSSQEFIHAHKGGTEIILGWLGGEHGCSINLQHNSTVD